MYMFHFPFFFEEDCLNSYYVNISIDLLSMVESLINMRC